MPPTPEEIERLVRGLADILASAALVSCQGIITEENTSECDVAVALVKIVEAQVGGKEKVLWFDLKQIMLAAFEEARRVMG